VPALLRAIADPFEGRSAVPSTLLSDLPFPSAKLEKKGSAGIDTWADPKHAAVATRAA
jgi:hypothetical protein